MSRSRAPGAAVAWGTSPITTAAALIAGVLSIAAAALLIAVPPARGSASPPSADPNGLSQAPRADVAPPHHRLSAERALAIADRVPNASDARRHSPGSYGIAYLKGAVRWQVSYYSRSGKEIAQVLIDDASGAVLEAWTGFRVAWTMARGYPGAFGRRADSLYIWVPLSIAFLLPFVDLRRPLRLLHFDLLALSAFSLSLAFFNLGDIETSVPLSYPPLAYLLVRMMFAARRRGRPRDPIVLSVPASWLAVAVLFLTGFRVGLNLADSNVIDVGYAGVIGAHRLADGRALYGSFPRDNEHGDTYGPTAYEAYIPSERLLGFSGRWDDLPAAHAAAIAFDLLALGLLFLIGRRVRGPTLGIALAYAWVTYPFTLFDLATNTNDALVTVLILAAILAASRAPLRGAFVALAGLSKFAPLALAPLMAFHRPAGDRMRRTVPIFICAFAATALLALVPVLAHQDLRTIYDRTLAFQAGRGSPFSIWGLYGGLGAIQTAVQIGAVGLALCAALLPRRRDVVGLAALSAAILIALQLGVTHWFYLYIVWFFPLVMLALLGGGDEDLLDRVGAHRARAGDHHAHQPGVLV